MPHSIKNDDPFVVYVVPLEFGHVTYVLEGEVEVEVDVDEVLRVLVLVVVPLSPGSKITPVGKSAVGNDDSDNTEDDASLLEAEDADSVELKDDVSSQIPGGLEQMK